jgi:hypothetical protein
MTIYFHVYPDVPAGGIRNWQIKFIPIAVGTDGFHFDTAKSICRPKYFNDISVSCMIQQFFYDKR